MEIFYNELSNRPLGADSAIAVDRVLKLLETLKSLREFGINVVRTHDSFYGEEISKGYSFASFFADPHVTYNLKLLLKTIVVNPYIEDVESEDAQVFISHSFSTSDHLGEIASPEGLACAYISSSPVISLCSDNFWSNEQLSLTVRSDNDRECLSEQVINVCTCHNELSTTFKDWIESLNPSIQLNSKENIYQVFSKSQFEFEDRAISDIISWYYDDKRYLLKVKNLLLDALIHPFVGGIGKTEPLSETGGKASKRIVKKDRLVYTYTREKILVHQCKGHYDDK